jgi:oligopeptide/dipeptide ABC transporter ATP-binding protein
VKTPAHDIYPACPPANHPRNRFAGDLFAQPLHPYTLALLSAIPEVEEPARQAVEIEGEPPSAVRVPPGCRFHPRCPWRTERCRRETPALRTLGPGHLVACHEAERAIATPSHPDG